MKKGKEVKSVKVRCLGHAGVATIALLVIAAVAAASSSVAVPVIVDAADVDPDSPLYGLERAGEGIRGAFADRVDWASDRAVERVGEYTRMAGKGRAPEFEGLLDDAEGNIKDAIGGASDVRGVEKALEASGKVGEVLTGVLERVPEQAKPAVEKAIAKSAYRVEVLENVLARIENLSPSAAAGELRGNDEVVDAMENAREPPEAELPEIPEHPEGPEGGE